MKKNTIPHLAPLGFLLGSLILACLSSCSTIGHWESKQRPLSLHEVQALSLGTELAAIEKLLEPTSLITETPVYWCPAKEGGKYVFYFWPTNEVEWPGSSPSNGLVLVAVTKVGDMSRGPDFPGGYYVLPKRLYGKSYTGLKKVEK